MKIRCYSKQELAMIYFPDADPHVAVNRLNGWIKRCRPLHEALQQCSLGKYSKFFSARQVALITEYLGES
ncbi:MAG: DUF4248 domain-containing protein [Prevotella sp.]|nr:DUF4248 domain-containing protein [Prevotella sp.]